MEGISGSLEKFLVNPSYSRGCWGFCHPHFSFLEKKTWCNTLMHELARVWQLTPTQKNLVPRFRIRWKKSGVLKSKTILPFPSSFFLGMVWPLNFEKLDVSTSSGTLGLIKDSNGILPICEIILEIKRFVVHSTDRIREATPELGNVEDVMNLGKMRR